MTEEGRRRRFVPLIDGAVAVAFALVISWRFLRPSKLIAGFDTLVYTTPNQAVTWEALRALRLPAWNPFLFGGAPHLANPQVGAFYFAKYPFLWLPPHRAVLVLTAAHVCWFALGMVALLSSGLRLRSPAPAVGAVIAVGAGAAVAQLVHFEQILTISWVPWLLLAIELLAQGRSRPTRGAAAVGLIVASMLLVGHTQPAYYALCFAGAWAVGRSWDHRRWATLLWAAGGVALGAALAAVQLVPTSKLVSRSVRSGGLSLEDVAFPPYLLNGRDVLVSLLGDPFAAIPQFYGEAYGAVGAAAAACAIVGFSVALRSSNRRTATLLSVVAVITVLFAAGPVTPVFRLAFELVPGFSLFRVPGRWLIITDIIVAVLAAVAVDAAARRDRAPMVGLAVVAGGLGVLLLFVRMNYPGDTRSVIAWVLAGTTMAAVLAASVRAAMPQRVLLVLLVLVPAVELGSVTRYPGYFGPTIQAADRHVEDLPIARFLRGQSGRVLATGVDDFADPLYLAGSLRPNVNATQGVRSIDGYDGGPWLTRRWTEAMEAFTGDPFDPGVRTASQIGGVAPEVAARFGVRWLVVDGARATAPPAGWEGPVMTWRTVEVWENSRYLGEAILYRRTIRPSGDIEADLALLGGEAASTSIVSGSPLACVSACAPTAIDVRRPRPERFEVVTDASVPTVLAVLEGWDPGWTATVDGRPSAVSISDAGFLAIRLSPGRHVVKLSYEAEGLRLGALITLAALLVVAVLVVFPRTRKASRHRAKSLTSEREETATRGLEGGGGELRS